MADMTPELFAYLKKIEAGASYDMRFEQDEEAFKAFDHLVKLGLASYHENEKYRYSVWWELSDAGRRFLQAP